MEICMFDSPATSVTMKPGHLDLDGLPACAYSSGFTWIGTGQGRLMLAAAMGEQERAS